MLIEQTRDHSYLEQRGNTKCPAKGRKCLDNMLTEPNLRNKILNDICIPDMSLVIFNPDNVTMMRRLYNTSIWSNRSVLLPITNSISVPWSWYGSWGFHSQVKDILLIFSKKKKRDILLMIYTHLRNYIYICMHSCTHGACHVQYFDSLDFFFFPDTCSWFNESNGNSRTDRGCMWLHSSKNSGKLQDTSKQVAVPQLPTCTARLKSKLMAMKVSPPCYCHYLQCIYPLCRRSLADVIVGHQRPH